MLVWKIGLELTIGRMKKELGTDKETTTSGEFLRTFLIHFETVELYNICTVRKTVILSFLTTLIEV